MGAQKNRGPLDAVLRAALWVATVVGAACGGLTGDKGDHVEVQNAECVTCHLEEYQATTKPPHADVKFATTCGDCHTQKAWVPAKFIHPFPLIGAHAKAGCVACHGSPPKYDGLTTQCAGCHIDDYNSSPYPGHQTFPTTCDDCHNTLAWKPASPVAHPFPLTGAHAVAPCESCHVNNQFTGLPQDCFGCHKQNYDSSPYPGHQTFPTTCQDCHSTYAWKPAAGFKHLWPLLGEHGKLDCVACHNENPPVYQGKSTACVSCHKADYDGSPYPGHQSFATTCDDCHTTNGWKPAANFQHPWPLTGAHTGTPCAKCHVNAPADYKNTPQTCDGCHLADYNGSPYPGHQTFSQDLHRLPHHQRLGAGQRDGTSGKQVPNHQRLAQGLRLQRVSQLGAGCERQGQHRLRRLPHRPAHPRQDGLQAQRRKGLPHRHRGAELLPGLPSQGQSGLSTPPRNPSECDAT